MMNRIKNHHRIGGKPGGNTTIMIKLANFLMCIIYTGIEKVEVDGNSQKVSVTGYAHRNKILKAVRRGGLRADFWSAQNELLNAYANVSAASASYGSFRFNNFF